MASGKVVRFDDEKGYVFIAPDDGGEDVFVHANELRPRDTRVCVGTRVEFNVIGGERTYEVQVAAGPVAVLDPPVVRPPVQVNGQANGSLNGSLNRQLDGLFATTEFSQQVTEIFLAAVPELTGAQIVKLRECLQDFAIKHGWTC